MNLLDALVAVVMVLAPTMVVIMVMLSACKLVGFIWPSPFRCFNPAPSHTHSIAWQHLRQHHILNNDYAALDLMDRTYQCVQDRNL